MEESDAKKVVRERYGQIAKSSGSCCGPNKSCCGAGGAQAASLKLGYSEEEINMAPEGANLGLGCGNPVAIASLTEGETVLDLGSGAGFDCFLAAAKVGQEGRVIGVDMTPEMVDRARSNARREGYRNVEFRLGEIENLPVADDSVDAVISNCVINLSTDKRRVFAEAFRVLKLGGRLMVSDLVLLRDIPDSVRNSVEAYVACIAGAETKTLYLETIKAVGFTGVKIASETTYPLESVISDPAIQEVVQGLALAPDLVHEIAASVVSIRVSGTKPTGG